MVEPGIINEREFVRLLSNQESYSQDDLQTLERLLERYPFCQAFHYAYSSALKQLNSEKFGSYLPKAAVYSPSRDILFRYIEHPEIVRQMLYERKNEDVEIEVDIQTDMSVEWKLLEVEEEEVFEEISEMPSVEHKDVAEGASLNFTDEIETVIPEFESPGFNPPEHVVLEDQKEKFSLPEPDDTVKGETPEERLIVESVAATDYFIFDKSAVDPLQTEHKEEPVSFKLLQHAHENEELSKYHDETLPFTFLWWLHKTRKLHDVNYQPYAVSKPYFRPVVPEEADLNQQIIENIFHHQPELNTFPEVLAEGLGTGSSIKKKEDDLIERFIKEEPQIKPPLANMLDTENKARKSSEDNLDLVSETLAKIYIDQMLYHKAVDTYKKLSLKFPEKRTYFAAQISDLEKRIN
ncbi:hypothetical protein [Desertivirga xinjiangensis]|uniref:hypothetical protein n=1 Tax=Desertivirga xinjiangensis TaxID=539206 RepID=UPI00210B819E|nr:hypothetical protein [Pedobacter xinjiangensis]